jgi:hypothetical protein
MGGLVNRKAQNEKELLQPRVFRLGLLQDGDVGVGVFHKRT